MLFNITFAFTSQDIVMTETQDITMESYSQVSPSHMHAMADSGDCMAEDNIVCMENSAYQTLFLEHLPHQTGMFVSKEHFNQGISKLCSANAQNVDKTEEGDGALKENPASTQQNSEDKGADSDILCMETKAYQRHDFHSTHEPLYTVIISKGMRVQKKSGGI